MVFLTVGVPRKDKLTNVNKTEMIASCLDRNWIRHSTGQIKRKKRMDVGVQIPRIKGLLEATYRRGAARYLGAVQGCNEL